MKTLAICLAALALVACSGAVDDPRLFQASQQVAAVPAPQAEEDAGDAPDAQPGPAQAEDAAPDSAPAVEPDAAPSAPDAGEPTAVCVSTCEADYEVCDAHYDDAYCREQLAICDAKCG